MIKPLHRASGFTGVLGQSLTFLKLSSLVFKEKKQLKLSLYERLFCQCLFPISYLWAEMTLVSIRPFV